jgi:glycosyltransferase involved in cell wall biosynthesis
MDRPLILHVTTDTALGGTESRLALFLEHRHREVACHEVVALKPLGSLASKMSASGVPVSSLEMRGPSSIATAARRLQELIHERNPSVVQTYLFHANTLARPIARTSGVPVVVSGYASVDPEMALRRRAADLFTARFAHIHFANCQAVADAVRRRTRVRKESLRVVYPGRADPMDPEELPRVLKEREDRSPPLVLSVGRLHRAKGHDVLLKALQGVRGRWEAVIVGDGPERPKLEQLAVELGIADRVLFPGEASDPRKYFKEASLFVLPSLWEGMPGVIIEAMLWNLPIVATSVGGVPEAVRHRESALLASPGDADTLSYLIEYALANRDLALEMARQARLRALEMFRLEVMVEAWEAMYLDALGGRR